MFSHWSPATGSCSAHGRPNPSCLTQRVCLNKLIVYDVLHHVCVCTWKVTGFINLAPAKYCVNNDNCDHYIEFVEYRPTNLKYDGATTIRSKLLCYRHGV